MQYASAPANITTARQESGVVSCSVTRTKVEPVTAMDHYWVTRALKAEALLAAREVYQNEVKTLGYHQDMKREVWYLAVQDDLDWDA